MTNCVAVQLCDCALHDTLTFCVGMIVGGAILGLSAWLTERMIYGRKED